MLKAILIDCIPPTLSKEEAEYRLSEAESLIKTYGGIVVIKKIQKKQVPDYRTYIGGGKLKEIMDESRELDANILIINNELKPHQTYNINEELRKEAIKEQKTATDPNVRQHNRVTPTPAVRAPEEVRGEGRDRGLRRRHSMRAALRKGIGQKEL